MSIEAMKQALEALEDACGERCNAEYNPCFQREAITALRQAIEQAEQNPVGHADFGINNIYIFNALEPRVIPVGRIPLYTAPPQRHPLTDKQIDQITEQLDDTTIGWSTHEFARAIEAAHGIKENNT